MHDHHLCPQPTPNQHSILARSQTKGLFSRAPSKRAGWVRTEMKTAFGLDASSQLQELHLAHSLQLCAAWGVRGAGRPPRGGGTRGQKPVQDKGHQAIVYTANPAASHRLHCKPSHKPSSTPQTKPQAIVYTANQATSRHLHRKPRHRLHHKPSRVCSCAIGGTSRDR